MTLGFAGFSECFVDNSIGTGNSHCNSSGNSKDNVYSKGTGKSTSKGFGSA